METKPKFRGYIVAVVSGLLMFLMLGSISTSAVFIPAIVRAGTHTLNLVYLMVTFATVSSTVLSLFFAATVISKLTPKWGLLLGAVFTAGHFAVYSLAATGPVWWLYVGAVMGGVAMAFGTSACISALISQWFIKDRTKITGLIFGAASIGMGIWQSIGGYLISGFGYGQA